MGLLRLWLATTHPMKHLLCFATLLFCTSLFANYAWIPKYQTMRLKFSGEYYRSTENFTEDGQRATFRSLGVDSNLSEYEFAPEVEYGFAKDWAGKLRLPLRNTFIQSASTGYGTGDLSAFGFGDALLSFTWLVKPGDMRLAIESVNFIPLYSASKLTANDISLGDGTFSTGLKLHGGYLMNGRYSFGLSPGFLLRFQSYSSQFTFDAAFGVSFKPVYFRLTSELALSLDAETLPLTTSSNPALGSGGSFGKLSHSPNLWNVGIVGGLFFYEQHRLELFFTQSVAGNRAPYGFRAGFAYATSFDFFHEEKKIKTKEVPFDSDPSLGH